MRVPVVRGDVGQVRRPLGRLRRHRRDRSIRVVVRVHVDVFQVRRRPRGVAPPLDFRRDRVHVEQIVDDEHRNEDEGEDDRKQTQHEAEALLAEDLFDSRLGRLSDLGRGHFGFLWR